jgi:hypothetical protein
MPTVPAAPPAIDRRTLAVATLAVAAHLAVLYWPVVTVMGPVSWSDKVVHLAVFAIPTYAVGRALSSIAAVALVFLLHAPVSELVQHYVLPGRSGDGGDALVDALGVAVGVAALVVRARADRW